MTKSRWRRCLAEHRPSVTVYDFEHSGYSVPLGLGIGQVVPRERVTFDVFVEPQVAVADKGAGWPQWQAFLGLNMHAVQVSLVHPTCGNNGDPNMTATSPSIPEGKRTSLGLYVTAKEAYEAWKSAPEQAIVLDVRTPEEYMFVGYPPMAWKVPVAVQSYVWDTVKGQYPMHPLADFVARVQTIAKPDDTLYVMCRSGGRSAIAVNMLAQAGFKHVFQIIDGMEGDVIKDTDSVFQGQRLKNGWKNSGCPWTYKLTPERLLLTGANA